MDIYPGISNVKPLALIKRERLLPRPGEVTLRIGQQVTPTQIVARTMGQPEYTILNAARVLGVPPQDVPRYLLVEEGATLTKGMPVMRKPGSLGRGKLYNSPVEGIFDHIYNGRLVLQLKPAVIELRALVRGYVNNVIAHRGITLETTGTLIQAIWGSGKEASGKIKIGSRDEKSELAANTIDIEAHGSVMVAGTILDGSLLNTLEQNGVKGLIVGSLSAAMCAAALQLSFPVILTDGIGSSGMTRAIFRLLQDAQGQEVSLFAQVNTKIGERPEAIIPLPANTNPTNPALPGVKLELGQTVRIMRMPYLGKTGKITRLYERAKDSDIGIRMIGADVTLPEGNVVYVPYPNLDLLI